MNPFHDRRRHKLVVHYTDGRIVKGNTYKLDPTMRGFYLIPLNPLPEEPEVYIDFADLKAVFYVKSFEGRQETAKDVLEEYIPEGHEVNVEFADGEIIKGFAFAYHEDSPRFTVDIPDAKDNNYAVLVEKANASKVTLGRVFRVKKLHHLVDTSVKMLLLRHYWDNPETVITVEALAEKIGRTLRIVSRDIQDFINEGLVEWVGEPKREKVRFLPAQDEETKEFIAEKLQVLK